MTRTEMDKYRQQLLNLARRLRGNVSDAKHEALRETGGGASGNLSNIPTHPADLASDNFEQETAVSVLENQEQILDDTNAALQRLEQGTFGKCEECGIKISTERLQAVPYTPYCVECAQRLEPRVRMAGNQPR
jgi:DnaK suppressor protein